MKERLVTRTIKSIFAKCLVANTETSTTEIKEYPLPIQISETKKLEYLKTRNDTDTLKIATILGETETENLYAMSEDEFIKNAKIMPKKDEETAE